MCLIKMDWISPKKFSGLLKDWWSICLSFFSCFISMEGLKRLSRLFSGNLPAILKVEWEKGVQANLLSRERLFAHMRHFDVCFKSFFKFSDRISLILFVVNSLKVLYLLFVSTYPPILFILSFSILLLRSFDHAPRNHKTSFFVYFYHSSFEDVYVSFFISLFLRYEFSVV